MTRDPHGPGQQPELAESIAGESLATARTTTARDPRDLSRLFWYLLATGLGFLAAKGAEQTTAGVEGDLVQLISRLPSAAVVVFVIAVQIVYLLLFLGIPLVLLATRQWRRWGIYTFGWVLTSILVTTADRWITSDQAPDLPDYGLSLATASAWPPSQSVAQAVCALMLLSPYVGGRWRRFGWGFVAVLALLRVITSQTVVLDIVLAIGIGGMVGTGLMLAFGRRVTLPTAVAVSGGLDRVGLHAVTIVANPRHAQGSMPFTAVLADGRRLHCKVITAGLYEADSIRRSYRRVRVRELGEDVAFSSVRRAAAVETMVAMSAARAGARTPDVAGVAPLVSGEEMVIAYEEIVGSSLADVADRRVTDDVLDQAWHSVRAMNSTGIAHRDLQASNWILDEDDQLWLIDFSFGEPASSEGALSADIAELLAVTYALVGTERAVAAAVRGIGTPALATGLSHLVPVALSRPTRAAVKARPDGLDPLISAAAAACGVDEPEFAPIERVKPRTVLMAGMLAVAVYVLLPQLADLPRMIEAIKDADPRYAGAALLASAVTYLGNGMALAGACPAPIRMVHAFLASVAATFVGSVTPPGVAHAGLNVRLFQKQGLAPTVAVSATAAKEVSVGVVHVLLLLLLALLAGSSDALRSEFDKLPSLDVIAIAVAVVIALIGVAVTIPRVRRVLRDTVIPALRESVASLRQLASNPVKMVVLVLGAVLLQLGYVAALYFSALALGADVGFVTIGLIYLTVGSVASVAPTPGGLGAVEAVLLAALVGVGMGSSPALAAVFLYRLATFWIPIPIGGLSFRALVARDIL